MLKWKPTQNGGPNLHLEVGNQPFFFSFQMEQHYLILFCWFI